MDLILWRHAEAEDGIPDLKRALTPKGEKQAKKMAKWLKSRLPEDVLILASPALRAQQTAAALGRDFSTLTELAPGGSAGDLLKAAGWPDNKHTVLIIGHQPTLGEVASILLTGQNTGMSFRKGAVWWLTRRSRARAALCQLRAVICPDLC